MTNTTRTPIAGHSEDQGDKYSSLRYARKFGIAFVFFALLLGAVSFVILLGLTSIEPTTDVITTLLAMNALFVLILVLLVGREVRALLQARRRGRAAARMHIRIVGLFGIVAAFPAIIVAVIAGITLDLGLDRIFDARTKSIVTSSIDVAESYVGETASTLNSNTINMGFLLSRNRSAFVLDRLAFRQFMTGQARARGLVRADLIRANGQVLVSANIPTSFSNPLPPPPANLLTLAKNDQPACAGPRVRNLAGCVVKLATLGDDIYLYTLRTVDQRVVNSLTLMEDINEEYRVLEDGRVPLQIAFALLYVGICLTILLGAIWMGIAVADRLVAPIRQLIAAADEVATGNLSAKVPITRSEGELRSLADTFNSMTDELQTQRDEILNTQELTDQRRRFTEAVLSGVTAGVIGVGNGGEISIVNSSATALLGTTDDHLIGASLSEVSPELAQIVSKAEKSRKQEYREQVSVVLNGRERTLNVQVSNEENANLAAGRSGHAERSHVITIDDISDLVTAQRTSAWADVARRIAHEIKNPLTPIQLSAERIRRRYGKVITEDREVFDQCTDTIVRQVADIGRMVDEFSSFARMPKPSLTVGDLADPIREAIFLVRVANPQVEFSIELHEEPLKASFDNRLLGQAFGNLVKNAVEAMENVEFSENEKPFVKITSQNLAGIHCIDVIDNGKGLPKQNRQRFLEPYMTTREKGTGLGLAIVGKILEEHGGRIELLDAPQVAEGGHGAMMRVILPVLKYTDDKKIDRQGPAENEKSNDLNVSADADVRNIDTLRED